MSNTTPPIIPPGHNQACCGTSSPKPKKCALLKGAVSEPSKVKIQSQSLFKTRKLTIHELKKKASLIWYYTEGGCNTVKEGNEYLNEISKIVDEIVTIEDVAMRITNE